MFKLFKHGLKEPVDFSQSVTSEDLARFVRLESGLWLGKTLLLCSNKLTMFLKMFFVSLGKPNTLENFDKLVAEFLKAETDKYDDFIARAEEAMSKTEEKDQKTAKIYVSTMKKIKEKGVEFVTSETARVNKLLKEKVSDAKKAMFKSRLDILASFGDYLNKAKDEL